MLSLYRALIALRRREPALSVGVHVKAEAIGSVLTYRRFHAGRWITVALNFADEPQMFSKPVDQDAVLISTHLDRVERERGNDRAAARKRRNCAGCGLRKNRRTLAGRSPLRLAMFCYLRTVRSWPLLTDFRSWECPLGIAPAPVR